MCTHWRRQIADLFGHDLATDAHGRCSHGAHAGEFTIGTPKPSYAPDLSLEPVHLDVDARFDLPNKTVTGRVTHTIKCNRAGARTLALNAVGFRDVAVGGEGVSHRYDGETITLTWERPFAKDETRKAEISYRVVKPITGLTMFWPDEKYPDRARFVCSDHETERARYWLPVVDYPTVRTTIDWRLTADKSYTILANGLLQSETDNGDGTKTAHWNLDFPCPSYLACIALGDLVRYDDESVGDIQCSYFAPSTYTADGLKRAFDRTPAMLRWIQNKLGPFPFKKYFQFAGPFVGGAMENISLVTWDAIFVLDETFASEFADICDIVNLHEMSHSYFGDAIVCRHFEHAWLKESWATYMEFAWLEEERTRADAEYEIFTQSEHYRQEADGSYVRPIVTREYDSSWSMFDRHLYPGGSWRLHMLRKLLGDDVFWTAVRDYVKTYTGKVVETEDFRRMLERHSGLNLNRFFDQWIYGKGYPKLKVSYAHDAEKNQATVTIEQTQKDEKSGINHFNVELDIAIEDESGWHDRTVTIEDAKHVFVLATTGKVKQLRIDPTNRLLHSLDCNPGDDLLKTTLTAAPDIQGRIWAARELIKTGKRANFEAVAAAMESEPFYGTRVTVASALGEHKTNLAIEPLIGMLVRESDPRAKNAIARACGNHRHPALRVALKEFLSKDQGYFARHDGMGALAKQHDATDVPYFIEQAQVTSLHSLVRNGALRALGQTRTDDAYTYLRGRLAYGQEPDYARHAAIEGFSAAAYWQPKEQKKLAAEALEGCMRDEVSVRARFSAAGAMVTLEQPQAAGAIESLKAMHAAQDHPRIARMLTRLRKTGDGEEAAKLRKQLEELDKNYRKLEDRMLAIESKVNPEKPKDAPPA